MEINNSDQTIETDKKNFGRITTENYKSSKKPTLKHNQFYCVWKVNKNEITKELMLKIYKDLLNEIMNKFMLLKGSGEGLKKYGLPIDEPREKLLLRIENPEPPESKIIIDDENINLHFRLSIHKRGLDTKLNINEIQKYLNEKLGKSTVFKSMTFKDAKGNLNKYMF